MNNLDFDPVAEPIFAWDEQGRFTPYASEEIVAKRMNQWKGWICTAGRDLLYVDFDGDIYRGVCSVDGRFGNIFNDYNFPETNAICTKAFCMCGSDIMTPKYRNADAMKLPCQTAKPAPERVDRPLAITGNEHMQGLPQLKRVAWGLGRRCNYDCSYCSFLVHNSTDPLRSKEELMRAARVLNEKFCRGVKTEFFISGGETTLQPGLLDVVKYLQGEGHSLVVISNGSHKPEIYRELIRYAHLCFSAHFQFLKEERYLGNVRAAVDSIMAARAKGEPIHHRVDVKLMTLPGTFDRSRALAQRVLGIDGFSTFGSVRFNPLFLPTKPDTLYDYPAEELAEFARLNVDKNQRAELRPGLWKRVIFPALRGKWAEARGALGSWWNWRKLRFASAKYPDTYNFLPPPYALIYHVVKTPEHLNNLRFRFFKRFPVVGNAYYSAGHFLREGNWRRPSAWKRLFLYYREELFRVVPSLGRAYYFCVFAIANPRFLWKRFWHRVFIAFPNFTRALFFCVYVWKNPREFLTGLVGSIWFFALKNIPFAEKTYYFLRYVILHPKQVWASIWHRFFRAFPRAKRAVYYADYARNHPREVIVDFRFYLCQKSPLVSKIYYFLHYVYLDPVHAGISFFHRLLGLVPPVAKAYYFGIYVFMNHRAIAQRLGQRIRR